MLRRISVLASLLVIGPASAQVITATLLGTAGPSFSLTQAEAGLLIQAGTETLLFDCGHLIPERLSQLGINNPTKVFLTHLHSDHTEGLPVLWMNELRWGSRGANPFHRRRQRLCDEHTHSPRLGGAPAGRRHRISDD